MPNRQDHQRRTLQRYGFKAEDIHSFMDEPSRVYRGNHREFRHDSDTIKIVGSLYGAKYGRKIAENIALDHIIADHQEKIKSRVRQSENRDSRPRRITEVRRNMTQKRKRVRRKKPKQGLDKFYNKLKMLMNQSARRERAKRFILK